MSLPRSVLVQGKMYVGGGIADKDEDEHTVTVYEPGVGWRTLPRYRYRYFGMAVLQDQLTLVGGWDSFTSEATNQISVWNAQQWTHPYPPMPTPRDSSAVVTYIKWLVVAGGSDGSSLLTAVEVMDTTNKQWFTTTPLPVRCHDMTSAIVGEECYFMGGDCGPLTPTKLLLHVSLPDITLQDVSQSVSSIITPAQWHTLPDTPVNCSAALSLHGSLLAVGGRHDRTHRSSAIHLYQPGRKEWVKVGDLPNVRSHCSCTLLPSGEILVAGGRDGNGKTSQVIVATVD